MNKVQAKQKQSLQEEASVQYVRDGPEAANEERGVGSSGGGGWQEERRREGERKQACQLTMRQGLAI